MSVWCFVEEVIKEREAHIGVHKQTGDLQPEVSPYDKQWFHPNQAHHESTSKEQCRPGVAPSE